MKKFLKNHLGWVAFFMLAATLSAFAIGVVPTEVDLYSVNGTGISLGQTVMASSVPVVIASNQSSLTVTGSGNFSVVGTGTAGTPAGGVLTVQGASGMTPLVVNQGTNPWAINNPTSLSAPWIDELEIGGNAVSGTNPVPVSTIPNYDAFNQTFTAVGTSTVQNVSSKPVSTCSMQVDETGSVTSYTVELEGSLDGTDFTPIMTDTNTSPGSGVMMVSGAQQYPLQYFETNVTALTLGSGTNVIVYAICK